MPNLITTRPIDATFSLEHKTSQLVFPDNFIAPTSEYQMAGGICWPLLMENNVFQGAAVLAGRNVKTGIIYVFEQEPFASIEHIKDGDGNITSRGLAPWFTKNWATYYAFRYYWFQVDEYNRMFRLRIRKCAMINPKPSLVDVHWADDEHAQIIISDYLEQHKLKIQSGTMLHEQLEQQKADPDKGPFPAIHAAACMLTGISEKRFPEE